MNVGMAILRIRHERRMTQSEVGARAKLATSYVSRIENGHVQPTMATLARIASALDVPTSSIFKVSEHGEESFKHVCPVSATGRCIGEQIRNETGRRRRGNAKYGREELRILKMADYVALHGAKETRKALLLLLESLVHSADRRPRSSGVDQDVVGTNR